MKLMTKEILKQLPDLGSTSQQKFSEIKVIVKFFLPGTRWTWYVAEYDPEEDILWGYCKSGLGEDCDEFGTIWLHDLESLKTEWGGVERDLYWNQNTTIQDVLDGKAS